MVPRRRLEDQIRDLCARLESATDQESATLAARLETAILEYLRRIDNRTLGGIIAWPDVPGERRKIP